MSNRRIFFKFIRVIMYSVIKGELHLPGVAEIAAEDLLERINSDQPPLIIDVRSTREFNSGFGHIANSRSIPMMELTSVFEDRKSFRQKIAELESDFEDLEAYKDMEIVTICPGGGMSLVAAEVMSEEDFTNVKNLTGGIDPWFKKGYPTTTS